MSQSVFTRRGFVLCKSVLRESLALYARKKVCVSTNRRSVLQSIVHLRCIVKGASVPISLRKADDEEYLV